MIVVVVESQTEPGPGNVYGPFKNERSAIRWMEEYRAIKARTVCGAPRCWVRTAGDPEMGLI